MNKSHYNQTIIVNDAINPDWKGLITVSGIILIIVPIISIILLYYGRILYASGYPIDPEAYLQLISKNQQIATFAWSGWIIIDILPLPAIIAMYIVLERHNRTFALLGSLVAVFYAIYDVSTTELNSLTLVSLAHAYANVTTEVGKSSLVSAATYGYYALPLQTVISFALGPIAYILWCVPMAKSFFGRWPAIIGIIVSGIGLIGTVYNLFPYSYLLGLCQFLGPRLEAVWSIVLGVIMYRYGQKLSDIKRS
jgi:hypothetical protein